MTKTMTPAERAAHSKKIREGIAKRKASGLKVGRPKTVGATIRVPKVFGLAGAEQLKHLVHRRGALHAEIAAIDKKIRGIIG